MASAEHKKLPEMASPRIHRSQGTTQMDRTLENGFRGASKTDRPKMVRALRNDRSGASKIRSRKKDPPLAENVPRRVKKIECIGNKTFKIPTLTR